MRVLVRLMAMSITVPRSLIRRSRHKEALGLLRRGMIVLRPPLHLCQPNPHLNPHRAIHIPNHPSPGPIPIYAHPPPPPALLLPRQQQQQPVLVPFNPLQPPPSPAAQVAAVVVRVEVGVDHRSPFRVFLLRVGVGVGMLVVVCWRWVWG